MEREVAARAMPKPDAMKFPYSRAAMRLPVKIIKEHRSW
jgi:hypothetical protein